MRDALVMLRCPVWGVHEEVEGKKNQYSLILQYIVWQCCINSETAGISILLYSLLMNVAKLRKY